MTCCVMGGHDFPIEDENGAYCEEHGVSLIFAGAPITEDDLLPGAPSRVDRPALPPAADEETPIRRYAPPRQADRHG